MCLSFAFPRDMGYGLDMQWIQCYWGRSFLAYEYTPLHLRVNLRLTRLSQAPADAWPDFSHIHNFHGCRSGHFGSGIGSEYVQLLYAARAVATSQNAGLQHTIFVSQRSGAISAFCLQAQFRNHKDRMGWPRLRHRPAWHQKHDSNQHWTGHAKWGRSKRKADFGAVAIGFQPVWFGKRRHQSR